MNTPTPAQPLAQRLSDEADQCRQDGADDIARLLDEAIAALAAAPQPAQALQVLTDKQLDELWRAPMSADWEHREYARAVLAAAQTAQGPDCDGCAHAALKESQEPCATCVTFAPARPMWSAASPQPAQEPVAITKIEPGFRWDGEAQCHVPQLLIELQPVPANSPCDAKGWADRDALAKMLSAPTQAAPAPAPIEDEQAAFEVWATDQGYPLQRMFQDAGYQDPRTDVAWFVWQARAAQAAPATAVAELVEALPPLTDKEIDKLIYTQCPEFDHWHEGPSIDDLHAIIRAALSRAPGAGMLNV